MRNHVQNTMLTKNRFLFIAWCIVASFGAYFSMYAFRKPFITGLYEGMYLWGMDYKSILIIAQVLGYMISKFTGIKVISELKPSQRIKLIIGLILFAELTLLGFGLLPYPYNFVFLFFNGLPLGMVWGIVFSFLEGRKFTEVLIFGLSISVIIASGLLKTIYLQVLEWFPWIPEFWMPFTIGALFLPLFIVFVWMLSVIPAPTEEDVTLRTERIPMNRSRKVKTFRFFSFGMIGMVLIYALLLTMRDFRDNFSVEIWNEIDPDWEKSVLSITELISGVTVLVLISLLSLIKNNKIGFWATSALVAIGLFGLGLSTYLYEAGVLSPFYWMVFLGIGLFMAYTPIQTVFFDRMLALYKFRANAGFFIYICDSIGYLGSVSLLMYKSFFMQDLNWHHLLVNFSYGVAIFGLLFLVIAMNHFRRINSRGVVRKSQNYLTAFESGS
ncbi:hypothetical protein IFO69_12150 [Echinicola sp. CAU 1574]|uniref:MFS transporter n=1 Tax=Echinicola arenosa TaxID=2774144 RepID=A0ABR9ANQ3_9BACT|nr:DUF5690 family protein [Echinicola arenosa]MBD8489498.1 hypothetical protein [Echinicola arenosa]